MLDYVMSMTIFEHDLNSKDPFSTNHQYGWVENGRTNKDVLECEDILFTSEKQRE